MDNYQERFYRDYHTHTGLTAYKVSIKESDLYIASTNNSSKLAKKALQDARDAVTHSINIYPEFLTSYHPIDIAAPNEISLGMINAAKICGVGPMAAVAGAVSEYVGKALLVENDEAIVENGGDIFICSNRIRKVLIYAGKSPVSMKMAIKIPAGCYGICTSAGNVGPSVSFGKADAAIVLSKNTALSDAAATLLGNLAKDENSLHRAVNFVSQLPNIIGAMAIVNDKIAVKGEIELTHP